MLVQELLALEGKIIQGLFATPDDRFYATLLAKVQLGNFQTQQKEAEKPRAKPSKDVTFRRRYCRDCEEATIHQTGSQLWVSCPHQSGWRSINSTCNLPIAANQPTNENEVSMRNQTFPDGDTGSRCLCHTSSHALRLTPSLTSGAKLKPTKNLKKGDEKTG